MRVFQGPNLAALHETAVNFILKHPYVDKNDKPIVFPGESYEPTIESEEFALVCKVPLREPRYISDVKKHPIGRQNFMDQYAHDILNGSGKDFEYEYHDRLVNYSDYDGVAECCRTTDQVAYMVSKMMNPTTRRAVAITWKPWLDTTRNDVPCLQLVHCVIRDGVLNMRVVFRSEDMLLGLGANMYGMVALQTHIAERVGIPVGTYNHIALCPHLYIRRDVDHLEHFSQWRLEYESS